MAISETTRAERNQAWLEAPVAVRTPSLRFSMGSVRKAAKAGARLHRTPVSRARRRAKTVTLASTAMASTRGMESGRRYKAARMAAAAKPRPSRPPAKLSSRPSRTAWRRITPERAPRARRTAYSRRRRMARTSSRPATFAGKKQNHSYSEEQRAQQRTDVRYNVLPEGSHHSSNVKGRHAGREVAHDQPGNAVRIARRLREHDPILEAGNYLVAPEAGVRKIG